MKRSWKRGLTYYKPKRTLSRDDILLLEAQGTVAFLAFGNPSMPAFRIMLPPPADCTDRRKLHRWETAQASRISAVQFADELEARGLRVIESIAGTYHVGWDRRSQLWLAWGRSRGMIPPRRRGR
ncbi:MAG TPA: hypothetical protein VMH38_09540 [Thermoplasmata archaeon]|nr:hypothetical protein [Thermoplasmata archaeon]